MKPTPPEYCWHCQKRIYGSEDEARRAIERLLRHRKNIPEYDYALRVYECRVNNGWHYGHSMATISVIKHFCEG